MTPTPRSAEEWARQVADRGLGWQLKMSEIAKLMAEVQADALKAAVEVCRRPIPGITRPMVIAYLDGRADCADAISALIPSPTTQKETTT